MLYTCSNQPPASAGDSPAAAPFHLLILSLALSSWATGSTTWRCSRLVYERTGSATLVALTTAARVLPIVVLGPLGGVLVDRYDRRRLIIASDLTRALLMLALAAVAMTGLPILLAPMIAAAATAAGHRAAARPSPPPPRASCRATSSSAPTRSGSAIGQARDRRRSGARRASS